MASSTQHKIIAIDDLVKELEKLPKALREETFKVLKEAGEDAQKLAIGFAPKDTGALRESIHVYADVEQNRVEVVADYPDTARNTKEYIAARVANWKTRRRKGSKAGSKHYYAFAVEYGTKNMPERPFMLPAFVQNLPKVERAAEKKLEEILDGKHS